VKLLAWALWIPGVLAAADLQPIFAGRSGTALVYDLKNERRAQQTPIRPGSVLKPFTLAVFIEAGLYRPGMKAPEALAESSNEFFDKLAASMDPEERDRGYARFGLNYRSRTATVSQLLDASRRLLARHKEARLRPVFEGMEQAISYGTARLAAIPAVMVAGKTGTTSSSALFFGYAPAEEMPRLMQRRYSQASSQQPK